MSHLRQLDEASHPATRAAYVWVAGEGQLCKEVRRHAVNSWDLSQRLRAMVPILARRQGSPLARDRSHRPEHVATALGLYRARPCHRPGTSHCPRRCGARGPGWDCRRRLVAR
ncbi:MAG TPA: siderophore-interacting protein [Corynebacterium urealyticum]|nr:siderophore-interacting protein [Corynebacterium urealyticum]